MTICQVFSFLSEANETPHFQGHGDMCHVAGFEPDTPSCPLLMESGWLCEMIPAIATRMSSLFLHVSVWLVTRVSNMTFCKILIIKLNISSSPLSKIQECNSMCFAPCLLSFCLPILKYIVSNLSLEFPLVFHCTGVVG